MNQNEAEQRNKVDDWNHFSFWYLNENNISFDYSYALHVCAIIAGVKID